MVIVLRLMLLQFGIASQLMFSHPPPLKHSEVDSSRISSPRHIHHSSIYYMLFCGADPYLASGIFYYDHCLWLLHLRVRFMWRLSAIEVLLELELP